MIFPSIALVTVLVLAGVRMKNASAGWSPGREQLAQAIQARSELKVTDDEHAYFHALYYGGSDRMCILICNDAAARVRWSVFSDRVHTMTDEEIGQLPAFLWLSPETRREVPDIALWAERHGYGFQRRMATEPDGAQKIGWRTYYEFVRR